MKEILQFSSTKERLKYLSGGFEEVTPKIVTPKPVEIKIEMKEDVDVEKAIEEATKVEEQKAEEKPKKASKPKAKKSSSKKGKKDEVQAK